MIEKIPLPSSGDHNAVALTAKNLTYLIGKKGVDAAAVCQATGLGIATFNSLRRGVGNPTLSTLMGLSNYFNVSVGELTEIDLSEKKLKRSSAKTIPLIKMSDLCMYLEQKHDKYDTYTTEIEETSAKGYFSILINNDSLYPGYSSGTVFIISKDDEPYDGDIVLIKIGTHRPCFRKIFINGDNFIFSSITLESDISPSIYKDYQMIGVVLKSIKTFSQR
ncbi:helix-turn-helix domain-containing protein [Glaciimonas immobilis]|uniref:SOS-response transcriptional repressor LexA n=1 Tax=Glaciimonas immobilis TaxID=728004 RepID=A0A840RTU7_9BURK|nr:helix-turn-helix domain-containing protein [Glaciimonas immobilis]KAF3997108.1 helix-turn-helix domain-containing protein [Glaciimonas immobilis]MBB5199970.1 SOS-response transcriptional repressor LexA [Glaciimonas immobilis]